MTAAPSRPSAGLLRQFPPFDQLPEDLALGLDPLLQPLRFRLGQTVLRPDVLPDGVLLLLQGQLRSLGSEPGGQGLRTIERLEPGSCAGWAGLLRREPCEHLRASTEVEALLLPAAPFRDLLAGYPGLAAWFQTHIAAAELHALLFALAERDPLQRHWLDQWPAALDQVRVRSLAPGLETALGLPPGFAWFASSGLPLAERWADRPLEPLPSSAPWLRLVGLPAAPGTQAVALPPDGLTDLPTSVFPGEAMQQLGSDGYSPSPEPPGARAVGRGSSPLALVRATGPRAIPIAICRAIADYFGIPLNRDSLADQVDAILQQQSSLNLINLGQILDTAGLRVVLTRVPADRLSRVPTPAIFLQNGHFGLLDGVDPDGQARLLEAELGPLRVPCSDLVTHEGGLTELLLLERKPDAKEQRFSLRWYLPLLQKHRRALVEVFAASFLISALRVVFPLGLMVLIQSSMSNKNVGTLLGIGGLMLVALLMESLVKTARNFTFTETTNRIDQEAKGTILDQMVRLPQSFFDTRPVGQIMFYISQLDRLREFLLGPTLPLAIDFLFSILYLAILLAISPLLTLILLSTVPLLLLISLITKPIIFSQTKRQLAEAIRISSFLNEAITGIQTIKSQNAELKTSWEFQSRYTRYLGEDAKLRVTKDSVANLAQFLNHVNMLVLTVAGIWLSIEGVINLGEFLAVRILGGYITGPMVQLVEAWQAFQMTIQQLGMVADIVDRPTEQTLEEAQNIPMPPIKGRVQLIDVGFRFQEDGPFTIKGVNLEIPVGAFVGMVGASGSGKSTLLKLLPRFYRPLEGKVLIDGLDINKLELYSLRRQIGVVPQESMLFDGTIRDNLLLVKPDATAEELIRATRIACAHDFIMELPKGYNSDVGERGAGLSGGQRQRLALARAVLQNPSMLILDEATSALDASTERQVCINLFEAFRGRTVFFITHRLSTVRPADTIVLMDKGALMEMGSHSELMAAQGYYYALFQSQNREGLS